MALLTLGKIDYKQTITKVVVPDINGPLHNDKVVSLSRRHDNHKCVCT